MFSLQRIETFRQEVKKSRFLATAAPVSGEEAAKAFIRNHSDVAANHNCWAWRVGPLYRFSDDGEPSGTAGKPILQAIDGQALDGVAVVVTRWFGGILLGSGGLIRAYGGTAAACLRAAEKLPIVTRIEVRIGCAFADLALVQARLSAHEAVQILTQRYNATGSEFVAAIREQDLADVRQMVADVTSGRAVMSIPKRNEASWSEAR
ncbi:YigZ family protein [Labrys sp. LIt4]|uniref:IMPACT family protein n=1 Tax=Labrys sp. LIt4 TaxID=2821355 RepID=UPI001ADFACC5|nr:YigZ family protein [Labrys sp. LIt4]